MSVRAKGAGMLAGAGVMALYALGFVAAAEAVALALVLPAWAANLIVAAVFVDFAGRALLDRPKGTLRPPPPHRSRRRCTQKEDARWARQQIAK